MPRDNLETVANLLQSQLQDAQQLDVFAQVVQAAGAALGLS